MLADALFRKAWIEIRYGPRETRTLTLGPEPLRIGSDAAHCAIYVKNVPAVACSYRFEGGRVICDDKINNRIGPVPFGVPMVIGRVTVTPFGAGAAAKVSSLDIASASAGGEQEWVLSLRGGREFTLVDGARLSAADVRGLEAEGGERLGGRSTPEPGEFGGRRLKNLSRQQWRATFAAGRQVEIDPGRSLRLETGTSISFGTTEGRIRSSN